MTACIRLTVGAVLSSALIAAGAHAADEYPAVLAGHAFIPAATFAPPPADAPPSLVVSGRFAGPGNTRNETLYTVRGATWLADPEAPRMTELSLPFVGQPVQGFSGIRTLEDGSYLVLTDNGFGSQRNSPDAMLMVHRIRPDWAEGTVGLIETVFLSDPDRVLPFSITNEHTEARYLTGADFDLESVQPIGDRLWFGDEFGPYLFATDRLGRVVSFHDTVVDGDVVTSPDNHGRSLPSTPGEVTFEVRRSRGFEGMAAALDGSMLYPLFEGPLWDAEAGSWEAVDGRAYLRILEFDVSGEAFTGQQWRYPLEADSHFIGDFNMIDETRALVIERDGGEGDPRLACDGPPRSDCFNAPAEFKRVYLIDLAQVDDDGFVRKVGYVDLMNIADPDGVAITGTIDGRFTFPFVTIEDVDRVDETHLIVANDNNLPFSTGRTIGEADNNEFILLEVGDFLAAQ